MSPTVSLIYGENYFGFVYIWRDKKRNRFYIGSHMGSLDDGYICSSKWMKDTYRRRPQDFKRRILYIHKTSERSELLKEEKRWLDMIKNEELRKKYFNITKNCFGNEIEKIKQQQKESWTPERREQQSKRMKARWTDERKKEHSKKLKEKWRDGDYDNRNFVSFWKVNPNVDEIRETIRSKNTGKKRSKKAREKMSKAAKARWQK